MDILFEDEDIIVLNKPAGITVNRSDTTKNEQTVQDLVESKVLSDIKGVDKDGDFYKRAGIVHRLDKETSGILLIAKNEESFKNLQTQFKNREVKKC
jgi:23S rRNA pseudouridine1911/1915/1917 synthase